MCRILSVIANRSKYYAGTAFGGAFFMEKQCKPLSSNKKVAYKLWPVEGK
jgi:hypothetical protein